MLRPQLRELAQSLASTAEKILNVRIQRVVQELHPTTLDAEHAAKLGAAAGSHAMLVLRWYFLDNDDLIIASRSLYPQGRMVFKTELIRSEPQLPSA
jgi:DNA-binding GntR family transcriptional regulator